MPFERDDSAELGDHRCGDIIEPDHSQLDRLMADARRLQHLLDEAGGLIVAGRQVGEDRLPLRFAVGMRQHLQQKLYPGMRRSQLVRRLVGEAPFRRQRPVELAEQLVHRHAQRMQVARQRIYGDDGEVVGRTAADLADQAVNGA